jgi:hypothetical protein
MTWLKSEIINITGEIEILDAAARWTEQDIENRLHLQCMTKLTIYVSLFINQQAGYKHIIFDFYM